MPAMSESQRRLMFAAAKDPKVAKRVGIKRSVAKEFAGADRGGKLPEKKSRGERWYGK